MDSADLTFDIRALENELRNYELKYGLASETFYQSYSIGEEPPEDSLLRDWTAWAGAYELLQQFRSKAQ